MAVDRIPSSETPPSPLTAPQRFAVPDTATDLAYKGSYPRMLYIGGAGNVTLMDLAGNSVAFVGCVAGSELVGYFQQVVSATATNLVAKW